MEIIRLSNSERDSSAYTWKSQPRPRKPLADMEALPYAAVTHTGLCRQTNQDNFATLPSQGLWLIADGMGGHAGGELAAALATYSLVRAIQSGKSLKGAVQEAHKAVLQAVKEGWGSSGMGTTVVALKSDADLYQVAWVGDSRAYLWDGQLHQLTRDHSYVQWLLDRGEVTAEEARHHPQSNAITQALGSAQERGVRVDCIKGRWYANQKILLCSDGLTRDLPDSAIADIIAHSETEQKAIDRLLEAALAQGGHDNISIILVTGPRTNAAPHAPEETQPFVQTRARSALPRRMNKHLLIAIAMLVILFVATCTGLQRATAAPILHPLSGKQSFPIEQPVPLRQSLPTKDVPSPLSPVGTAKILMRSCV